MGRTPHTTAAAVRSWLDAVTAARLARSQGRLNGPDIATAAELADRGLTGRHR